MLKALARRLPPAVRRSLRAAYHGRQLARGTFRSPEPEWDQLAEWLGPGDTALDVGANVGHYTARMSELVGPAGHVVALEPVPETFAALVRNARRFRFGNVTLLNLAAGDEPGPCRLSVPSNGYLARVDPCGPVVGLAVRVDALGLAGRVRLVKVDAEGYEPRVLAGMGGLLRRDRPIVILERNAEAERLLQGLGYRVVVPAARSPNVIALPPGRPAIPEPSPPS